MGRWLCYINMDYIKNNKKQIIIVTLLLIGIILGVYLVQVQHIFKSKATDQIYNTIEVRQIGENGDFQPVSCQENNCTTNSLDIQFKVNVKDLEDQINSQE